MTNQYVRDKLNAAVPQRAILPLEHANAQHIQSGAVRAFVTELPQRLKEYHAMVTDNSIFKFGHQHGSVDPPVQAGTEGFSTPPGEVYVSYENPKDELGFYIVSDGGPNPIAARFEVYRFPIARDKKQEARGNRFGRKPKRSSAKTDPCPTSLKLTRASK